MKYAFSGGRETVAEHRKHGGIPEKDVSYQYLTYFMEDSNKLKKIYEDIRKLNVAMRDRLLATGKGDANVNAIVRLDVLAITATDFLEGNLIGHLEGYFDPYLK